MKNSRITILSLIASVIILSFAPAIPVNADTVVYVTKTGTKYHSTRSCRGLNRAKSVSTMMESEAKKHYSKCSLCWNGSSSSSNTSNSSSNKSNTGNNNANNTNTLKYAVLKKSSLVLSVGDVDDIYDYLSNENGKFNFKSKNTSVVGISSDGTIKAKTTGKTKIIINQTISGKTKKIGALKVTVKGSNSSSTDDFKDTALTGMRTIGTVTYAEPTEWRMTVEKEDSDTYTYYPSPSSNSVLYMVNVVKDESFENLYLEERDFFDWIEKDPHSYGFDNLESLERMSIDGIPVGVIKFRKNNTESKMYTFIDSGYSYNFYVTQLEDLDNKWEAILDRIVSSITINSSDTNKGLSITNLFSTTTFSNTFILHSIEFAEPDGWRKVVKENSVYYYPSRSSNNSFIFICAYDMDENIVTSTDRDIFNKDYISGLNSNGAVRSYGTTMIDGINSGWARAYTYEDVGRFDSYQYYFTYTDKRCYTISCTQYSTDLEPGLIDILNKMKDSIKIRR